MHRPTTYLLALLLVTAPALTGCNRVRARVEFKKGNALYQQESYAKALPQFQKGLELDPSATFVWRSVGLSALALYRPGEAGRQNREYERIAIDAFEKYLADEDNDDPKVREYLLTMYVSSKQHEKALAYIDEQITANPDKTAELQAMKVNILTQSNRLEQAAQVARQIPRERRPEALYSVGVSAWDKSFRDPELDPVTREKFVDIGLASVKEALDIRPEYFEAMVYYNLLFREKAKMVSDPFKRQEYIDQATEWQKKAQELRKKTQAQEAAQQAKPAA